MANNSAAVTDHQGKPFPSLDQAARVPPWPTKAARNARKADKIPLHMPERSNKSLSTNNITPGTAKSSLPNVAPKRVVSDQQTEIFAIFNSRKHKKKK